MNQERFSILIAKVLNHEASAAEVDDFHRFITEDAEAKDTFQRVQELWNSQPSHTTDHTITEESYLLHLGRLKDKVNDFEEKTESFAGTDEDFQLYPVRRHWYQKWQSYAAVSILLIASVFSVHQFNQRSYASTDFQKPVNEIKVARGAKTNLQLPDGSKVWVNSDSKLTYAETFSGAVREVYLEGEAYFDVVKDPAHPFIVHTSGIDVRVLGTAFNVKAYKSESTIEATLVHGMIEVTKTGQPNAPKVILKPHEKLIFDKDLTIKQSNHTSLPSSENSKTEPVNIKPVITITPLAKNIADSAIIETAWVYNRLTFEEERFDNLAVKMERWFNVKISIHNDRVKSYKLTGSFENETIEEALNELKYLVSFNYKMQGREIIINGK